MAVNSKMKGNTFERKISNILSARFEAKTGLKTSFKRDVSSGAFFGGKNQARMETHDLSKAEFGDIVTPGDFVFSIECKHYKTPPSFSQILDGECRMFDDWIAKGRQDAKNSGRKLCVIMKFNNVAESVILEECFGDLTAVMSYKGTVIVPLTEFLKQADDHFFKNIEVTT